MIVHVPLETVYTIWPQPYTTSLRIHSRSLYHSIPNKPSSTHTIRSCMRLCLQTTTTDNTQINKNKKEKEKYMKNERISEQRNGKSVIFVVVVVKMKCESAHSSFIDYIRIKSMRTQTKFFFSHRLTTAFTVAVAAVAAAM